MVGLDVGMTVPRHIIDAAIATDAATGKNLDETHAAFEQPAGREALLSKDLALRILDAVEVVRGLCFQ